MINKKSSILFSFILAFLLISGIAQAQQPASLGLAASPQIFEIDVFPGEKISQKINLRNLSEVPVPIQVKLTDFTAGEDSGEMEFNETSQDPSVASRKWFKIENPNFILETGEKKEVQFEISIPENAEPGGHYSVMLFEPQLPSFYFKPGQPKTIPVVGVLFLISVKTLVLEPISTDNLIEIVEFKIPREEKLQNLEKMLASVFRIIPGALAADINIVEKTPSSFFIRIKNNDIFHHKLDGRVLIYNIFGKRTGEIEIKRTTILPGKIRQFPVEISPQVPEKLKWLPAFISNFLVQNTSLGKYRVALELGEEKSKLELNQTLNFWVFPWKIILPSFLLLILLVIIRKRIVAALKILISRKF